MDRRTGYKESKSKKNYFFFWGGGGGGGGGQGGGRVNESFVKNPNIK